VCELSCTAIPFFACSMLVFSGLVSLEKTIDRPFHSSLQAIEPLRQWITGKCVIRTPVSLLS
jgi:hypothetical protein